MRKSIPFWYKAPMARAVIPFSSGIWAGYTFQFNIQLLPVICLLLLTMLYRLLPVNLLFRFRYAQGMIIHLLFFLLGMLVVNRQMLAVASDNDFSSGAIKAEIIEEPTERTNTIRALAHISNAGGNSGKAFLYFPKNESLPAYGNVLYLRKKPEPIRSSNNPGSFDFKRYCYFRQVSHQVFLKKNEYLIEASNGGSWFRKCIISTRKWVLLQIQNLIPGKEEKAIAEALLIGYRDDLEKETLKNFSATGVIHLIAISGLHLGLVYAMLLLLTRPLKKRNLDFISILIVVTGLWMFSFLSGAQPSVVRSAIMFSCIALGDLFRRKASSYNSLALAAFLILLHDPFVLWNTGFQLSFAAVLGILSAARPLYQMIDFQHPVTDFFWQMISVTLSAQLFTLPLTVFYFHQFPLLFIPANLVALPLASIILFLLVFLCILSPLGLPAVLAGKLASLLIGLMVQHIKNLSGWEFTTMQGLSISTLQFMLFIMLMALLAVLTRKTLLAAACCLLSILLLRTYSFYHAENQKLLTVYNINRFSAVELTDGRHSFLNLNSRDVLKHYEQVFAPAFIDRRIRTAGCFTRKAFIFEGKKVLIADHPSDQLAIRKSGPHILVITGRTGRPSIKHSYLENIEWVVLDNTVAPYARKQWKSLLSAAGTRFHDVNEEGAFVMDLSPPTFVPLKQLFKKGGTL